MHGQDKGPGVGVLIPAGGTGSRMGGRRKQFRTVGEVPLLVHTALIFAGHPGVAEVIVAVPEDAVEEARSALSQTGAAGVHVVAGGHSRQASVRHALSALSPERELVLVHDAVRPFVSHSLIDAVIAALKERDAAAAAVPSSDTLRRVDGHIFAETVERNTIYRMQTPQGFRRETLERAHQEAVRSGTEATDDVALVQALGVSVYVVPGDERNIKLTTESDWELAALLWDQLSDSPPGRP